jgi:hypothetical protein
VAVAKRALFLASLPEGGLARSLQELLGEHEGADPLCRHGAEYGTVCSTILALRGGAVSSYLFAAGQPCTTPFAAVRVPVALVN